MYSVGKSEKEGALFSLVKTSLLPQVARPPWSFTSDNLSPFLYSVSEDEGEEATFLNASLVYGVLLENTLAKYLC